MKILDAILSIIEALLFLVERSELSREEKDALNKKIREKFESLPPPSTLKDTVEKSE
jgi:hypothetical protein